MNTDTGSSVINGLICLKKHGACLERFHPYHLPFNSRPSFYAFYDAYINKKKIVFSKVDNNVESFKTTIADGRPIITGIYVNDDFQDTCVVSEYPMPMNGHCCVIYGYYNTTFLARNSWGPDWGLNGNFQIPFSYMNNITDSWTLMIEN